MVIWRKGTLVVCTHLRTEGDTFNVFDLLPCSEVPNSVVAVVHPNEQDFTIVAEDEIVNISIVLKLAIKSGAVVGNFIDKGCFVIPSYVKAPVRDVWAPFRLNWHVNAFSPLMKGPAFDNANKS